MEEAPLARLRKKTTIEVLWLYFLKLLNEKPMCGYELMKETERRFGWRPPVVTSYIVIQALKREGYIEVYKTGEKRKKTLYRITSRGRSLLAKGSKYLRELYLKIGG